jgi:adenine/guanine phosphoribosyltransferase-like PRPP-binding protein
MLHYDTHRGLSDLTEVVTNTVNALRARCKDFDSIAVMGTSGLIVGSAVSVLLRKPLVVVRPDAEMRCFHNKMVENKANMGQRVLFLDDQISTGRTLKEVQDKIAVAGGLVTGTYMYQYDRHDAWSLDEQCDYGEPPWWLSAEVWDAAARR